MSQKTYHFPNPRKLIANLTKELTDKEIQNTNLQIKNILSKRKQKLRSLYLSKSHEIIQPHLQPTKKIYPEFAAAVPIATEQPFISEKIKENILRP